jgi:hypothetical protein
METFILIILLLFAISSTLLSLAILLSLSKIIATLKELGDFLDLVYSKKPRNNNPDNGLIDV